ncbi:ABC transporter [Floricoccus tropicus]|uniref:ABC transporter n=1 Tax=Floricoccus tropicus TaxID=1859473 RepID=A0A1E8GIY2_9LACT|nr:ABC transporter ATP-binding protein [Floricoccus tropicus]OFI48230.1 ABC transporter [Floricoccus tropicus]
MNKAIEIQKLSKSFGNRKIIDNLNLTVMENEIVSLVGPSGCGKSTLLNMIGMLETVDSGKIKLFGKELPKITSKKATLARRDDINYLFQSFALVSDLTVKENLLLAMNFMNIKKSEKEKRIIEVLTWLDIDKLINEKVNKLSGGEQQRVAIARAILKPGDLILADEPTGSLDPLMAENVFSIIEKLRDNFGKTIIVVTHSMELANRTDRIIQLEKI